MSFGESAPEPEWSADALAANDERKRVYYRLLHANGHLATSFDAVEKGERLPERVIGPHSVASFTTEHRARPVGVEEGQDTIETRWTVARTA